MRPTDEDELWRRAAGGDVGARDELRDLALAAAEAELPRHGVAADDVGFLAVRTAESALRFLDRGGQVRSNLRAFLQYRARAVLSEERRRSRPSLKITVSHDVVAGEPSRERPVLPAQLGELRGALADCLSRLAPDARRAIELRYLHDEPVRDIAARLGQSAENTSLRLHRALRRLRRCLIGKHVDLEVLE